MVSVSGAAGSAFTALAVYTVGWAFWPQVPIEQIIPNQSLVHTSIEEEKTGTNSCSCPPAAEEPNAAKGVGFEWVPTELPDQDPGDNLKAWPPFMSALREPAAAMSVGLAVAAVIFDWLVLLPFLRLVGIRCCRRSTAGQVREPTGTPPSEPEAVPEDPGLATTESADDGHQVPESTSPRAKQEMVVTAGAETESSSSQDLPEIGAIDCLFQNYGSSEIGDVDAVEAAQKLMKTGWVADDVNSYAVFEDRKEEYKFHLKRSRALSIFVQAFQSVQDLGSEMMTEMERLSQAVVEHSSDAAYWKSLAGDLKADLEKLEGRISDLDEQTKKELDDGQIVDQDDGIKDHFLPPDILSGGDDGQIGDQNDGTRDHFLPQDSRSGDGEELDDGQSGDRNDGSKDHVLLPDIHSGGDGEVASTAATEDSAPVINQSEEANF